MYARVNSTKNLRMGLVPNDNGTDTLPYDYITLLVKCGIHSLVYHITRYTTTVDTHTKAHESFSCLLGDLMDEIYYNYDWDCLSTMYPRIGSILNPLLG
jgi:hypothetical protein